MSRRQRPFGRLAIQRAARRRRGRHAPPGWPPSPVAHEPEEAESLEGEPQRFDTAIDEVLAEAGLAVDCLGQISER
jgi:hypothetical protein